MNKIIIIIIIIINKSTLRRDSMLPTSLSAYMRCMSPANILGSQFDNQFGR